MPGAGTIAAMLTLGIETSCDETGVALYHPERGLLAHQLFSQIDLHAEYGGVVPELASRDHIRKLLPLIQDTLAQADCTLDDVEGVAVTVGPGLIGALMAGASVAAALAMARGLPFIGVHHMEGHLLAPLLEAEPPAFPFVALLVSGGHSQLVEVRALGDYHLLGDTLDDAAGEAFDKVAKMLGLGYPGGPAIAALARRGRRDAMDFPRPMTDRPGLDFSFSGLKTHTLMRQQKAPADPAEAAVYLADLAAGFEEAVVDTLVIKSQRALRQTGLARLVIAGGVSANQRLREKFASTLPGQVFYASPWLCTDNGAMIAHAGCLRLLAGQRDPYAIETRARWPLDSLRPPSATG